MKPVTIYIPPAANDNRYPPSYGRAIIAAFIAGVAIGRFWGVL